MASRSAAQEGKWRTDNARAKGIIYGAQDDPNRPVTPKKGKKVSVSAHGAEEVPFATFADSARERYGAAGEHKVLPHKRDIAVKAGAEGYSPSVYAANRAANHTNMEESKARNYTGSTKLSDGVGVLSMEGHQEYHPIQKHKELTGKISGADFDPQVYRGQLQLNQELQESARARKFSGSCAAGAEAGSMTAPFAQTGAVGDEWQREYHAKPKKVDMTPKVGSAEATYDNSVYRTNMEANASRQVDNIHRNFVGSGNIITGCAKHSAT